MLVYELQQNGSAAYAGAYVTGAGRRGDDESCRLAR